MAIDVREVYNFHIEIKVLQALLGKSVQFYLVGPINLMYM